MSSLYSIQLFLYLFRVEEFIAVDLLCIWFSFCGICFLVWRKLTFWVFCEVYSTRRHIYLFEKCRGLDLLCTWFNLSFICILFWRNLDSFVVKGLSEVIINQIHVYFGNAFVGVCVRVHPCHKCKRMHPLYWMNWILYDTPLFLPYWQINLWFDESTHRI